MSEPEIQEPTVSAEFIEESRRSQLDKTIPKAGGPYSKSQRRKRRQEVMRLHFELCLPAIKIADMLGVSRHTINADIQWLYEKMVADIEGKDFNGFFGKQLVRLETQRTRLMSYLSEAKDLDAKLSLERQLADHDFRLAAMVEKFKHNTFTFWDTVVEKINELAESEMLDVRYTNVYEPQKMPKAKRKMIDRAIEEEEASLDG